MARRQSVARALLWSVVLVGSVLLGLSLPPIAGVWDSRSARALGPATTTPSTVVVTSTTSTTVAPTTAPVPTTLPPPITVGPPVTVAPPTAFSQSTTTETTSTSSTTTSLPELLVPAPPGSQPEVTTAASPAPSDEGGISAETKLALAVTGLLLCAALIAGLTVVYFLRTRPGVEEEETLEGSETAALAEMAPVPPGTPDEPTQPDIPVVRPSEGAESEDEAEPEPDPGGAWTDEGLRGGRAALAQLLADSEDEHPSVPRREPGEDTAASG